MSKNSDWTITLDDYSKTPKYMQIVNAIANAVEDGMLKVGDKLPSVNKLLVKHDISRDTIVKAYDLLKKNQIIESVPGKGYYVKAEQLERRPRILLLFNKLSAHKKIIYDAFSETLGEQASIDFYIYHNDFNLFKNIILDRLDKDYSHFVIITHFNEGGENAIDVIRQIPPHKLIILDKKVEGLTGKFASIYQDFGNDIYQALTELKDNISKYHKLKLIFPFYTYHPSSIKDGFQRFCAEYAFRGTILPDVQSAPIDEGDAFICLMEDDLVHLIKRSKELGLNIGSQLGIISYNETLLKEILLDGITTISTDFKRLGKTAAAYIRDNQKAHIANPFYINLRHSL